MAIQYSKFTAGHERILQHIFSRGAMIFLQYEIQALKKNHDICLQTQMLSLKQISWFIFSMETYNPKLFRSENTITRVSKARADISVLV